MMGAFLVRSRRPALSDRKQRFERTVLPHLDAAYNLARWLTRNDHDAQDVVQEAALRAYRFFDGLRGEPRPWLLAIVRNSCMSWIQINRPADLAAFDDRAVENIPAEGDTPEGVALRAVDRKWLNEALATLPAPFREALVLRELEDLAYKDIARIADVPIGTVMSRLSRGRRLLAESLRALENASSPRARQ
jgi:RNA polymerase sigma-70 factor, ECF subfamily